MKKSAPLFAVLALLVPGACAVAADDCDFPEAVEYKNNDQTVSASYAYTGPRLGLVVGC